MDYASRNSKTGQRQVRHEAVMKVQHQLDLVLLTLENVAIRTLLLT